MITAGTTRRWRTALSIALLGLAGFLLTASPLDRSWPGSALAAESDESPAPSGTDSKDDAGDASERSEAARESEEGVPDATEAKPEAGEDESEEVFVPSEDISEDIDVPFPVDI